MSQVDMNRVEELVADRLAAAIVAAMGEGLPTLAKKIEKQVVEKAAYRLAERFAGEREREPTSETIVQQVVERAAQLVVKLQKDHARDEERLQMVKTIRNPIVPHLLEELRALASSEASGKTKGSRTLLLNNAFKEFGSYSAVLKEVESGLSTPSSVRVIVAR